MVGGSVRVLGPAEDVDALRARHRQAFEELMAAMYCFQFEEAAYERWWPGV